MIAVVLICALLGGFAALRIATPFARSGDGRSGALVALAIAAAIMTGALAAYAVNGQPDAPGQPYAQLAERLRAADPSTLSAAEQEERLRDAIRSNPEDAQALALLGRFLSRTERELEAVSFFERALRLDENPRTLSDLGQALVVLNDGQVTPEAERAFRAANTLDPSLPEPAFFLGAAAYERGERASAAALWTDIIGRLDAGDPFRAAIAARAADLLSRPSGGPGSDGAAPFAAAAAEGADMDTLVAGMIDGLQARLEDDPADLSGWLTLARARLMQGEPDAGRVALERARTEFDGDPGALALIAAMQSGFPAEERDG